MKLELAGEWVVDGDGAERQLLAVREVLVRRRTRYQQLEIVDTLAFGRMLLLDGQVQSSERDEFVYHEALVQPAMLAGPRAARVLILGGGEGATLREVLAHASVTSATMVDIDQDVVQACREHLPMFSRGSFEDARAQLVIAIAARAKAARRRAVDVIDEDVTDPTEQVPPRVVRRRVLRACLHALTPHRAARRPVVAWRRSRSCTASTRTLQRWRQGVRAGGARHGERAVVEPPGASPAARAPRAMLPTMHGLELEGASASPALLRLLDGARAACALFTLPPKRRRTSPCSAPRLGVGGDLTRLA
ncbi:MAG: hypothetical protein U1E76_03475 [Planctomycetota bacterium]